MKRTLALLLFITGAVSLYGLQAERHATTAGAQVSVTRSSTQLKPEPVEMIYEDHGVKIHPVHVVARHADGSVFSDQWTHNLRTNGGGDWQANVMSATSAQAAAVNYIALTNDATAPAATDCVASSTPTTENCTLTSEISTNGLARAQGTFAHTAGTATYTVSKTFNATGTQASQKTGLIDSATINQGVMAFEATYSPVTVNNGDSLTITWTINY